MTKIFLSYAEEDSAIGIMLARALLEKGETVYWWEDPDRPGERFEEILPNEIYGADGFVAVLTEHYLRSPWCRREAKLAVTVENELHRQFITVVQPAGDTVERPGWLTEYAKIALAPDGAATAAAAVLRNLANAMSSPAAAPPRSPDHRGAKWSFRNRDDELDLIGNELTIDGGTDIWLLSGPPQLGKSWLLYAIADRVTASEPSCRVRLLSLKDFPRAMAGDCAALLQTMFDLPSRPRLELGEARKAALVPVAAALAGRTEQQMYLLDSADLLTLSTVRELRGSLSAIFDLLRRDGWSGRARVVISGRQVHHWRPVPEVRSRKLSLTGFTDKVVRRALRDLGPPPRIGDDRLTELAEQVHDMCEGMPALLVPILDAIDSVRFIGMDDAWWQDAYESIIAPHIRNQLLSVDSLFPAGGLELDDARAELEETLRRLVVFRIVSRSTLGHFDAISMFDTVRATALFGPVSENPWDEIYRPLRRLLYRYYYPTPEQRRSAEEDALRYYRGWAKRSAEAEQPVILAECIWHEAARLSTGVPNETIESLVPFASALAVELLLDVSRYGAQQLALFAERRLDDDEELVALLRPHPQLFENVVTAVRSAIEGMGDG